MINDLTCKCSIYEFIKGSLQTYIPFDGFAINQATCGVVIDGSEHLTYLFLEKSDLNFSLKPIECFIFSFEGKKFNYRACKRTPLKYKISLRYFVSSYERYSEMCLIFHVLRKILRCIMYI